MLSTDTINRHLREAISGRDAVANFAAASRGFVDLGDTFQVGHETLPRLEATVFLLGAALMIAMSHPDIEPDDVYDAAAAGANLLACLGQNTAADVDERKQTIQISIERIEAFLAKVGERSVPTLKRLATSMH